MIWIIEFFMWSFIIVTVSFLIQYKHSLHIKNSATAYVFFQDANGLIVGSPVKFMGAQVGYVSSLRILNGETYVNFIITNRQMKIPQGTSASIEFSGLAGSKSLELYPPTTETIKSGAVIKVVEPIRIDSFMERQNNIAMNILNITNDVNLAITKNNINQIQQVLSSKELFNNWNRGLNNINNMEDKALNMFQTRLEKNNGVRKK